MTANHSNGDNVMDYGPVDTVNDLTVFANGMPEPKICTWCNTVSNVDVDLSPADRFFITNPQAKHRGHDCMTPGCEHEKMRAVVGMAILHRQHVCAECVVAHIRSLSMYGHVKIRLDLSDDALWAAVVENDRVFMDNLRTATRGLTEADRVTSLVLTDAVGNTITARSMAGADIRHPILAILGCGDHVALAMVWWNPTANVWQCMETGDPVTPTGWLDTRRAKAAGRFAYEKKTAKERDAELAAKVAEEQRCHVGQTFTPDDTVMTEAGDLAMLLQEVHLHVLWGNTTQLAQFAPGNVDIAREALAERGCLTADGQLTELGSAARFARMCADVGQAPHAVYDAHLSAMSKLVTTLTGYIDRDRLPEDVRDSVDHLATLAQDATLATVPEESGLDGEPTAQASAEESAEEDGRTILELPTTAMSTVDMPVVLALLDGDYDRETFRDNAGVSKEIRDLGHLGRLMTAEPGLYFVEVESPLCDVLCARLHIDLTDRQREEAYMPGVLIVNTSSVYIEQSVVRYAPDAPRGSTEVYIEEQAEEIAVITRPATNRGFGHPTVIWANRATLRHPGATNMTDLADVLHDYVVPAEGDEDKCDVCARKRAAASHL